ncbi:hypothetical protein [Bordetella sp. N]|uniref:hypothetical protein n=1 Tax=Bordetella sp. N TaxID=1746199 RepID=UPI0012E3F9F7|nr:hypothetical protein [Bordetella sp. N]
MTFPNRRNDSSTSSIGQQRKKGAQMHDQDEDQDEDQDQSRDVQAEQSNEDIARKQAEEQDIRQ